MKQEELKKDYVLLSKIAKEKKYAQEYLGLLARRGDIGSIRIGKRWYTTREWFSEFLADAEAKKAEMKNSKNEVASVEFNISEKIEIAKVPPPAPKNVVLHNFPERNESEQNSVIGRENILEGMLDVSADPKNDVSSEKFFKREEKTAPKRADEAKIEIRKTRVESIVTMANHPFQVRKDSEVINLAKKTDSSSFHAVKIKNISPIRPQYVSDISSGAGLRKTSRGKIAAPKNVSARRFGGPIVENSAWRNDPQKRVREENPLREWKFLSKGASPNFASNNLRTSLFQKFAFSAAAVLLLVLIFQFGLVFKNDIKKTAGMDPGIVAGAEDSKVGLSSVKDSSLGYLADQEGKVRENISLSRVFVKAAMERENTEIKLK